MNALEIKDNALRHALTALIYTAVSVVVFGLMYPFVMTGIALVLFPKQANGSMVYGAGKPVASAIIGQLWAKPQYFHGRPSAAGKGYDPTSTGATNLAPTSKKLIDATRDAIAALRKDNPEATGAIPMDLVTSSASGIDPDITPDAAYYQAPRVAKARGMTLAAVNALIAQHTAPRTLGFLGEPRVNVLEINMALDAPKPRIKE
jgi:K+-transporting ATPase ATPase C chain